MKYFPWIFLLCMAFVSGCDEEVPLETLDTYQEKLVVNDYFTNSAPFSIQVSVSKDLYKKPDPVVLTDNVVKVTLKEGGNIIPLTYDVFDNVFYSASVPVPGKEYVLSVSANNLGTVSAVGKIPSRVTGKSSIFIEDGGIDMQGNKSDLLKLTFTDNGSTHDYYKLSFFYYSELVGQFHAFDFDRTDVLAAVNTIKTRDGGFLFSDELFNGKSKTLTAVPPMGLVKANTTYKYLIRLERLSEEYWKYINSLEQYRGGSSVNNFLNGAVVVYSNVNQGLGIFAGGCVESDTLK